MTAYVMTDYCALAAAQVPGRIVASLRYEENVCNWAPTFTDGGGQVSFAGMVLTFTDGGQVSFTGMVVSRFLPDGQDLRQPQEDRP